MFDIFTDFVLSVVAMMLGEGIQSSLGGMLDGMLYAERLVSEVLTSDVLRAAYTFIYTFACSLVLLKFLFKGFQIYILWRDGDADSSPQDMLIGMGQAVIVMLCFPALYDIMAEATAWFTERLARILGLSLGEVAFTGSVATGGLFLALIALIYLVMFLVFYVKLIQRGFELLVLRLGVPFACLSLIDSDAALFKSYMQIVFKTLFTSIVQLVLLSLSFCVFAKATIPNVICGIAILSTAFATPTIMQQLLIAPSRGGGITSKIYSASMVVRAVRGLGK